MKRLFLLGGLFLLCIPFMALAQNRGYVNPSAAYCEKMGYQYETRLDVSGNAFGVCILPNDSVVDAWDFFRGKVATEYSYCEKMGYSTEFSRVDSNGFITECAVCVQKRKTGDEVRIPLTELMEQNGEPLIDRTQKKSSNFIYEKAKVNPNVKAAPVIPESFDWRNFNEHSYIGGVRNQGGCGSCYAFGANACAEGTYNVANGLFDASCIDLSESFIAWCLGSIQPYSSHFNGCAGADYDYMELQALCDSGVCFESSFPYVQSNPGTCTHWGDKRIKLDNWYRVDCQDTTGIKSAIMNYGVVDAAVYVSSAFDNYDNGIFTDANTSCSSSPCYYTPTNHAIALVGWGHDPVHGLYWILRNSWGASWGENGYMRIKWNAAVVSCEVCYMEYIVPDANNPTGFNATPLSESEIELSWSPNPNNDPVMIAWSADGSFGTPVQGVEYSAGNLIPGGGNILYYGNENSFTHSALPPATTYYYKAWSNSSGTFSTGVKANAKTDCLPVTVFPWNEGFENAGSIPDCWSQLQVNNSGVNWQFITGNGATTPSTAHTGTYNACLKDQSTASNISRLISPVLNLGNYSDASLIFWHTQPLRTTSLDTLSVFYRTSGSASWTLLKSYPNDITSWNADTLLLPNLSQNYSICFEGDARRGRGICVDDVSIVTGAPLVPLALTLSDSTIDNSETACFNATETITVAGAGTTVDFLSGSSVNLIAGQSVVFLPGFHSHEGSYLYAWITETGDFCNSLPMVVADPVVEKSVGGEISNKGKVIPSEASDDDRFKIFPNPNNGNFTVDLHKIEGVSTIKVSNTMGAVLFRSVCICSSRQVDIGEFSKGIYFVTVQNGNSVSTRKIVVQ